ncbi:MAG: hypothetical protein ABJB97_11420, partial [Acidobacteriota bacterium]
MKATITQTENNVPSTEGAQGEKRRWAWRRGSSFARRRKKLVAGLAVVIFFYAAAIFADFLAPYDYRSQLRNEPMSPPNEIHFRDADGSWHARPFIYARRMVDPLERSYAESPARSFPLALFTKGYSYKLLGLLPSSTHL